MNETAAPAEESGTTYVQNSGTRLDTLEALLNAFQPREAEGHAALRREIGLIRDESRRAGIPVIAAAAAAAYHTETAHLNVLTANLIALMRDHARGLRRSNVPAMPDMDLETGVMNRPAFMRALDNFARVNHSPVAVAAIHVDGYASVQHRHGDEVASMLLTHVAGIIKQQLRDDDCIAHFSGDEFMILLPGEDRHGLDAALARLEIAILNRPFRLPAGGGQETVRLSKSSHQFFQKEDAAHGTATDAAPLRIGHAIRTPSIHRAVLQMLRQNGCEPVGPGNDTASHFSNFARPGTRLVILECETSGLPKELLELRTALMRHRTPVLVLAADEATARWAIEHGASDALVKPINLNALLNAAIRLASRGHKVPTSEALTPAARVVVASDDLYHLIALGSALQKQGGYEVYLAHGSADASLQIARHQPSTALLDLRLWHHDTGELLRELARQQPGRPVVLIADKGEKLPASTTGYPPIAGVLEKPVPLLTLASEFRRATGIEPANGNGHASEIFRQELLRVMRNSNQTPVIEP